MYKIMPLESIREAEPYMDAKVLKYIDENLTESFESFEHFDLVAFDWYDVQGESTDDFKMLIYLDEEDLFLFHEGKAAGEKAESVFGQLTKEENPDNERILYLFFTKLLKGDMNYLDNLEAEISDDESRILSGKKSEYLSRITAWRQELLRLKKYYEQLNSIFDEMVVNDNGLLSRDGSRRMTILRNRTDRYLSLVESLQESVTQLREAYQSQLAIEQNELMKIFTIVTVIFLPLSLLAGWYGMNFTNMPELKWQYGYPAAIVVSALIVLLLIWKFKRKKWL